MPKYTIIDYTDNEARLLAVSKVRKKPLVLESAVTVDLSDLDKEEQGLIERGQRMREAAKRHKMNGNPSALILPKQNSIVRTTILPSSDPDELAEMAEFEAAKYIPFNAERHVVSTAVLHQDDIAGSQVLITAVDGPVINSVLSIVKEAGFEPQFAEVSSIALFRAFSSLTEVPVADTSTILLYISSTQTEISILRGGTLIASRSQAVGMKKLLADLGDAMHLGRSLEPAELSGLDMMTPDDFLLEEGVTSEGNEGSGTTRVGEICRNWMQRIVRFVRQSFEFAVREHDVPPASAVYLCGEVADIRGLAQSISLSLSIDVHDFDAMENLQKSPTFKPEPWMAHGLSTAIGTALRLAEEFEDPRARENRINLLPLEVIERQEAAERKVLLMISGTMVVITLILLYLAYDTQARHTDQLVERYRAYNREMKPTIDSLDVKSEQLEIIRQITENRAGPLYILDRITEYPRMGNTLKGGALTLTDFKYTVRNEVTIGGTAIEFSDMQEFAAFLEGMTYGERYVFSQVEYPQPSPIQLSRDRGNVYAFSITAQLTDFTKPDDEEE